MASSRIPENSSVTITVPASSALATFSNGSYSIDQTLNFANYPPASSNVFRGSGKNTTSAFTNATQVTISAGPHPVLYSVGPTASVIEIPNNQPTPGTLNTTGTLTAALLLGGI